jgi:hypothetical protein
MKLMKRSITVFAALASLALSACATGPRYTPYQAAQPGKFGFSEQRIEATRYRIIFEGNSRTTRQRVEDSLLLRAANVTLENGYDWFQIVNRATDPKTYQMRIPSTYSAFDSRFGYYGGFATYRYWSPRHGWVFYRDPFAFSAFHDPFWRNDEVREVTRFQANAEIILGKGPKPTDRSDTFDARDVSANLTPRVIASAPPR